jgi:hypothetical protein
MSEHQIKIEGLFEPVAIALSTLGSVSVLETSESHIMVTLTSGGVAVARDTPDGVVVELTTTDGNGLAAAALLAADLCAILDYEISPPEQKPDLPVGSEPAQ